ncbi:MAG TPA: hypothetical protein VMP03_05790 [Methylomirabilota bacterium]|nr:hypothetical protein [Methylomirabilota bacterium]
MVMRIIAATVAAVPLVLGVVVVSEAQEVYRDRTGVWRYVEPPTWQSAPPPVPEAYVPEPGVNRWRGPRGTPRIEGGAHLRGVVPSYDDPYPDETGVIEPSYDDRDEIGSGLDPRDRLRAEGYFDGAVRPDDPSGAAPLLVDPSFLPGDPQRAEVPLGERVDQFAPQRSADIAAGLARYAAAKRAALGLSDPGKRLQSLRSANAYLVSLSDGPVSTQTIVAIDTVLGLEPITRDTTQLPGAGTSVVVPDRTASRADIEAAGRVTEYGFLRIRGQYPDEAAKAVGAPETFDRTAQDAVDTFLGVDSGRFAAQR